MNKIKMTQVVKLGKCRMNQVYKACQKQACQKQNKILNMMCHKLILKKYWKQLNKYPWKRF